MKESELLLWVVMGIAVCMLCCCGMLIYIYKLKKKSHIMTSHMMKSLEYQKEFYEARLEQEESIRQFRHDFKHHLQALAVLCREERMDEVMEYIRKLTVVYETTQNIRTGNVIANYFIHAVIKEFEQEENFEYQVLGNFPDTFRMDNGDFCILLANALENAKEALKAVTGKRKLMISIKHYGNMIFLTIANTALSKEKDFFRTSKKEKKLHGYGTGNMRNIVKKYRGRIEWIYEGGMCIVKIRMECHKI